MKVKEKLLLALLTIPLTLAVFDCSVYAEERRVLSRNYVGLKVEVYASYQCYPNETIVVRVKVEALEDVKNLSVTMFIWGSKAEGDTPWATSFTVIDVTDFLNGTTREEEHNITIPSDIDPGLTYGILFLNWSVHRSASWENQWDKASFRTTYVKNKDCEELQTTHTSVLNELENFRTLMYALGATTIAFAASTMYFARRKTKAKEGS